MYLSVYNYVCVHIIIWIAPKEKLSWLNSIYLLYSVDIGEDSKSSRSLFLY